MLAIIFLIEWVQLYEYLLASERLHYLVSVRHLYLPKLLPVKRIVNEWLLGNRLAERIADSHRTDVWFAHDKIGNEDVLAEDVVSDNFGADYACHDFANIEAHLHI